MRIVEWDRWKAERRGSLGLVVRSLQGRSGPKTHRPRSEEEWAALVRAMNIALDARERSGRWTWTGPREITIRPRSTRQPGIMSPAAKAATYRGVEQSGSSSGS